MSDVRVSAADRDGHVVAVIHHGGRVQVEFVDGSDPVDLTDRLADLLLVGVGQARRDRPTDGPDDTVEVAHVTVSGPAPTVLWLHPPARFAASLDLDQVLELARLAVTELIVAGAAADAGGQLLPPAGV